MEGSYENHKAQIRLLKSELSVFTGDLDHYLEIVINNCMRNFNVLSNIVSELNIAEASGVFDLIILSEIHGSCERIRASQEDERSAKIVMDNDIFELKNNLKQEKRLIMNETLERASNVALARFATERGNGLISFLAHRYETLGPRGIAAGGLVIFIAALIRFINHCTVRGYTKLVNDLRQMEDEITLLTKHTKSLEEMTVKRIQYQLENYLESIKKGIKYHSIDGERTKEQARKMIRETTELQSSYLDIGDQASQTLSYLRDKMHTLS